MNLERELSLEIARVTELAALASAPWMGRGEKNEADGAATEAMREMFNVISIQGTVVIGEGEMDEAPMLYIGEQLGNGHGPVVDVAVDPLEGTELVANGQDNALSVVAIGPKGSFLNAPDMYMQKLAVGPKLAGHVSIEDPIRVTLRIASVILNKSLSDLTVMILDRERHADLIQELREIGVRIKLISNGDVVGAIAPAFEETGIDLYVGSGGAPEGVLAAAALKCLGGELQGRLMPENEEQIERCKAMGIENPTQVLLMDDMVGTGDIIFSATGITQGEFLGGVKYLSDQRAETHTIVMRAKSKTVRRIHAIHDLKLKNYFQRKGRTP